MAEVKMQFRGWQAVVVVIAIFILVGYRFLSQEDMTGDPELVQKMRQELMFEVYPDQADRLEAAQAAGDTKKLQALAAQVANTKIDIQSLKASQPLFDFSSPRDVVIQVTYQLQEGTESKPPRTDYHLFEYHALGSNWRHVRSSTALSYYFNFL